MKRLIITFLVMVGSLYGNAQINPKIDSLVHYVDSLDGTIMFHYHLLDYESVPRCYYRIDHLVHDSHSLSQRYKPTYDSIYNIVHPKEEKVAKAIRNTCQALSKEAEESYMWEYHNEGVDSIKYAIKLGGEDYGVTKRFPHMRYLDAPNSLRYSYTPNQAQWSFETETASLHTIRHGGFEYEYVQDSILRHPQPIDIADFTQHIQSILAREGVEGHSIHIRCDSTLAISNPQVKIQFAPTIYDTPPYGSEIKGMVYTIYSNALAKSVLHELQNTTFNYILNHPNTTCEFYRYNYFDSNFQNLLRCPLPPNETVSKKEHEYNIYYKRDLHDKEKYYIVITDTQGWEGRSYSILPYGWQTMKSWINGKIEYYAPPTTK